jgi:menaquinone-dependent protoporphyrinogen IX oxidase
MKTLIVCASRYGSTMEIGRWMAERLPWSEADHSG